MKFSIPRRAALSALGTLLFAGCAAPATSTPSGFPFSDEDLNYSVNWPSGLNLGEGHMHARRQGENWTFDMSLNASIPGFDVSDQYASTATPAFCTLSFERTSGHGPRKTRETETVSSSGDVVRRTAAGGGTSRFQAPQCVRDALTFLYFTRRELGQGRVPPPQRILFGALYAAHLEYAGAPVILVGGKPEQSDKLICAMTGPASNFTFEIYFARDAARTPLVIRVPLSMGQFSMELVR